MKVFKRNAIILTMIVFVCAAIYLNWAYDNTGKSVSAVPKAEGAEGAGLYYAKPGEETADYFAAVRLERQQARDAAMSTLNTAVETMSISQQARDNAVSRISDLTGTALRESEMESMIKAKGFADCVVFLKEDTALVTVAPPAEGLSDAAVAQIADIIVQETDMTLEQIRIKEVK